MTTPAEVRGEILHGDSPCRIPRAKEIDLRRRLRFSARGCVRLICPYMGAVLLISLIFLGACSQERVLSTSASGDWIEFQGTWTAAGSRHIMPLGANRRAVISQLDGSLVLSGRSRAGVGFRSEAIVFNDSATGLVGRAVWTDEHGDEAFSELVGTGTAASNKIRGTFIGGTGRYSGITGTYDFSWRFVLENEDGSIQGQSEGLNGKVRMNSEQARSGGGPPRS